MQKTYDYITNPDAKIDYKMNRLINQKYDEALANQTDAVSSFVDEDPITAKHVLRILLDEKSVEHEIRQAKEMFYDYHLYNFSLMKAEEKMGVKVGSKINTKLTLLKQKELEQKEHMQRIYDFIVYALLILSVSSIGGLLLMWGKKFL